MVYVVVVLCVRICIGCPSCVLIPPWRFVFYAMDADDVTDCVKRHPLARVDAAERRRTREGRRRWMRAESVGTTTVLCVNVLLSYVIGARTREERDLGRARVDKGGRGGGVSAARDDDAAQDVAEFERFALAPRL